MTTSPLLSSDEGVLRLICPVASPPLPLCRTTAPLLLVLSNTDPASRPMIAPLPLPLVPADMSIDPAADISLDPVAILMSPVTPPRASPDSIKIAPDEVLSTASIASIHDDEPILISPVLVIEFSLTEKRFDCA